MSIQLCRGLALSCALSLLLLTACNRYGNHKRADSHRSQRPSPVNSPAVSTSPSESPIASATPPPENTSAPAPERPSPFLSPPQTTVRTPKAPPQAKAAKKPFIMPPSAVNTRDRIATAEPAPPAVNLSTPVAGPPLLFRETLCCSAIATYEPARPTGLQRLIRKVPKGLIPPHPLKDIQFSVPPDASSLLMQKKRMDLRASVDASGRVTRVELLYPKDERLVALAADAANRWKFAPAQLNDQPVPGELILHFSFDTSPGVQIVMDKSKPR